MSAEQPPSTFSRIRKVASAVILVALIVVLLLFFKKPTPVAEPLSPAAVSENARSFQQKMSQIVQPAEDAADAPAEVRFTVAEIQAALVEGARQGAAPLSGAVGAPAPSGSAPAQSPSAQLPSGQEVTLQSTAPVVTFEGDVVRGQFQAQLAGQNVTVTVAGHLGSRDGYATFDPTEFKIGEMSIPVSLVNDQLQKKMVEQREQLKLPENIAGLRVENGQLVIQRK